MNSQNHNSKIMLVKKTLGKNGKYYYYESLEPVIDPSEVYWYRTDEYIFNRAVEQYKDSSVNIKYDEVGDLVYMEYFEPKYDKSINEETPKTGCLSTLFCIIVVISCCYVIN